MNPIRNSLESVIQNQPVMSASVATALAVAGVALAILSQTIPMALLGGGIAIASLYTIHTIDQQVEKGKRDLDVKNQSLESLNSSLSRHVDQTNEIQQKDKIIGKQKAALNKCLEKISFLQEEIEKLNAPIEKMAKNVVSVISDLFLGEKKLGKSLRPSPIFPIFPIKN